MLVAMPQIQFGAGAFEKLPAITARYGRHAVVVTGGSSRKFIHGFDFFLEKLKSAGVTITEVTTTGEPSPEIVDNAVSGMRADKPDVVVAIGGGSVLDAGKAISAMIPTEGSVELYMEEVGDPSRHPGIKVPFIAVPTTAGTGSEATRNAVLSRNGPGGFKRSLRHYNFVPDVAVVDPVLSLTCPPEVTAACGMDALTQLLESFVSTGATDCTDDLCRSGLRAVAGSLLPACGDGGADLAHRSRLAYAAMLSGFTLTVAGLGVVHGIASELGATFSVPHGVACGTMLAGATEATVLRLLAGAPEGVALKKYAEAGEIMCGKPFRGTAEGAHALVELLVEWTHALGIPRLGKYGMKKSDIGAIAGRSGNKNNPARLLAPEIEKILEFRV